MQVLPPTDAGIALAADHLRRGGVVGMPTETVYGLAAVAFDAAAIARVFAAKDRPLFDPLIAHVAPPDGPPLDALRGVADPSALGPLARRRLEALAALWPGPLTLVLPKDPAIPDLATAGLPTVGVRMPAHPVAERLIRAVGAPLVAPSANRFGAISPTTAAAVVAELDGRVPMVLDGGPCAVGLESAVVALDPDGGARLLRPGGLSREVLERAIGGPLSAGGDLREAPGQSASHYAPRKPLRLLPGPLDEVPDPVLRALGADGPVALLRVVGEPAAGAARLARAGVEVVAAEALAADGDLARAARRLFAALRELDAGPARVLLAEPAPHEHGLGHAIADRLRRAAAPRR